MSGVGPPGPADERVLDQAEAYLDAGRYEEARRLAGQHLVRHPDDARALLIAALTQRHLGRIGEALRTAERATAVTPGDERAWRVLATIRAAAGLVPGGIDAATRAVQLAPDQWLTHLAASLVLAESPDPGDHQHALAHAEAAVQLAPTEPEAHVAQGTSLLLLNRSGEAVEAYRRALRLDPTHPTARANLRLASAGRRHPFAVSEYFGESLRHNPGNAEAQSSFVTAVGNLAYLAAFAASAAVGIALAIGLVSLNGHWQGTLGPGDVLWPSLILLAGLAVFAAYAVGILRRGGTQTTTILRHHPILAAWLALTPATLIATLVAFLAGPPFWVILLVALPLYVAFAVALDKNMKDEAGDPPLGTLGKLK